MHRRTLIAAGTAGLLAAPALRAQAAWPHGRPIRVVCPWPPGAANDMLARLTAAKLAEKLGAVAVAENRTGGAGLIGTREVLGAAPDGYTLLASALNTAVMPLVLRNANFDPQTDLEICARTAQAPLVMAITASRPQRTLAEAIAAAKENPKDWSIAITSLGAASHLATIELNRRTGANLEMVAYRGTQPALQDLMAGNVHLLIDPSFNLLPHAQGGAQGGTQGGAQGGRIRALGIASAARSPLAPEVPTMSEAGLPGYEFQSWYGVWAPRGTPAEIVQRVHGVMQETMREPEIVQRLTQQVLEPVTESIADSKRFVAAEILRATELLRSVNYQPE